MRSAWAESLFRRLLGDVEEELTRLSELRDQLADLFDRPPEAPVDGRLPSWARGGDLTRHRHWSEIDHFRYHFDRERKSSIKRPELRLQDYVRGVVREAAWEDIDVAFLRRRPVLAVDGDGHVLKRWPVWRCLVGELDVGGTSYVLDEGDFFAVAQSYLKALNRWASALPEADVAMPPAGALMHEAEYNRLVATSLEGAVLLDRLPVSTSAATTPVEICDVLTANRQLIHVKRHLGSRDLSHLFSQGWVSAELLQNDRAFREAAQARVDKVSGARDRVFPATGFRTDEFEVVYAIVADWRDRTVGEALPFFSKVNLQRTERDLQNRGFRVSTARAPISPTP